MTLCSVLWSDAAFEHQHQAGLRQWQGRRAELHPEPEPVPLYLPQRARPARREEAQPERDAHGGRRDIIQCLIVFITWEG